MPGAASALNWVVEVVWKLMCKVNQKDTEKQGCTEANTGLLRPMLYCVFA